MLLIAELLTFLLLPFRRPCSILLPYRRPCPLFLPLIQLTASVGSALLLMLLLLLILCFRFLMGSVKFDGYILLGSGSNQFSWIRLI